MSTQLITLKGRPSWCFLVEEEMKFLLFCKILSMVTKVSIDKDIEIDFLAPIHYLADA